MDSSPKKLRLGSGEGEPTAASSKGKDKAPTFDDMLSDDSGTPKKFRLGSGEGDPTAASSKGKDKVPTLDDMLSDDSGDGSSRASSDFSSVSEAREIQDPDLAPPLSKRSKVGLENAQRWKFTMTDMADQLELEGDKRVKFKDMHKNERRSKNKLASRQESTTGALASLATAYNKGNLRLGDLADPDFGRRKQRPDHGRRAHPQAWSLSGTIDLAFKSIGALCQGAAHGAQTRRPMDAIAAVALAALAHQQDALRDWSRFYLPASGPKWVCMTRSHDSTPIKIRFGQLQKLQQVARYWHKHSKTTEAQLLSFEDIKQTAGPLPSHGIAELMAQMGCIAWPEQRGDDVVHQRRNIFFPPKFLDGDEGLEHLCMHAAGRRRLDL